MRWPWQRDRVLSDPVDREVAKRVVETRRTVVGYLDEDGHVVLDEYDDVPGPVPQTELYDQDAEVDPAVEDEVPEERVEDDE